MVQVLNFPFPTAPDRDALAAAEHTLRALGALDADGARPRHGSPPAGPSPISHDIAGVHVISHTSDC